MTVYDWIIQNIWLFTSLVVLFLIVILVGGFLLWYFLNKQWKYKIVIFQKVGKTVEDVGKDKAKLVRLGVGGDMILYLKKNKKFLPLPKIQTGRNKYWYYIREDGEWINIGVEDIDVNMKLMGVHFLDKEARHARASIQKIIEDRTKKETFWQKHYVLILQVIVLVIFFVGGYFWLSKYLTIIEAARTNLDAATKTQEATNAILGRLDTILGRMGVNGLWRALF